MAEQQPLTPFTVSVAGAEDAVRSGLAKTMTCLAPLSLSEDDAGTVELVLAEALNNVIEHALAATDGQTAIEIHGKHDMEGLHLSIIDQGVAMPKGRAPTACAPDVNVAMADMPEGGFGWFMIHTLAQEVQYVRIGDENHLTLTISIRS
ncbi:MAG: ATP-binding protein [Sulfitobacter sp.]